MPFLGPFRSGSAFGTTRLMTEELLALAATVRKFQDFCAQYGNNTLLICATVYGLSTMVKLCRQFVEKLR
jgi:hypothetical protein